MTKDETNQTALAPVTEGDQRRDALLRALGFDKLSEGQRELALSIATRYDLDPMLRHVVMVDGKPYITRDGLLHVAHKSGVFDGIEVDTPVLDNDGRFYRTTCRVYRKDFSRPFVYPGRYPATGGNARYNEEMCIKVGEVMTLRRAFDVSAPVIEEQWDGEGIDSAIQTQPSSLADKIAQRALAAGNAPEQAETDAPASIVVSVVPDKTDAETVTLDVAGEEVAIPIAALLDDEPEEALFAPVEPEQPEPEDDEPEPEPEFVSPLRQTPVFAKPPEEVTFGTVGLQTDDAQAYDLFKVWAKDHDTQVIRSVAKELFPTRKGFGELNAGELGVVQHAVIKAETASRDAASERCAAPSPKSANRCTLDPGHSGMHRHGTRESWD